VGLYFSELKPEVKIDRRLGWSTVPSNDFVARVESNEIFLEGTG